MKFLGVSVPLCLILEYKSVHSGTKEIQVMWDVAIAIPEWFHVWSVVLTLDLIVSESCVCMFQINGLQFQHFIDSCAKAVAAIKGNAGNTG